MSNTSWGNIINDATPPWDHCCNDRFHGDEDDIDSLTLEEISNLDWKLTDAVDDVSAQMAEIIELLRSPHLRSLEKILTGFHEDIRNAKCAESGIFPTHMRMYERMSLAIGHAGNEIDALKDCYDVVDHPLASEDLAADVSEKMEYLQVLITKAEDIY